MHEMQSNKTLTTIVKCYHLNIFKKIHRIYDWLIDLFIKFRIWKSTNKAIELVNKQ